ncbi:MAG TPA: protein kinase [Vicinamibacteria bacterium]|nr:protein kinase [Vicinamibacteria bacterium]
MPASGDMWKQFKLLEPLGKGGMGRVFLAEDTALGRKVALKFLPPTLEQEPTARERFLREARAAAALDHPYICKVYEIGDVDGKAFIAMEYIEGPSLRDKVAAGPLPLAQVLDHGIELAEAIEAAHAKGIVHRDIKSQNIMITREGHVKILDFGVAKALVMEALGESQIDTFSGQLTSSDATPGTVIYMSPEQVRGETVDGRTDVFSLGVVLYEMATGQLPFEGATSGLIYDAILNLGPRPPRHHNLKVPEELERVILKALEKDREHRYQNAKDLMVDLKRLRRDTDTVVARSVESRTAPTTKPRKSLVRWALTAAILAVAAIASYFLLPRAPSTQVADSLAVLPFDNTRGDPEVEYLSEGIAETLINRLSSIPELKVMARSKAFRFRGHDVDPQTVGRELNVGAVLTGRVVQQGNNLNVQTELVDVRSGVQLWGEQYNRALSDIVAVQEEIAQQIAQALRMKLTGEEASGPAPTVISDSESYQAYWKGRFHWNRRTNEDFKKAIAFFEDALVADPELGLAHVGLADSYLLLGAQFYGPDADYPPSAAMAKARSAASEALRLNPDLAEAHVTLAYIEFLHEWNWEAAERGFLRAIELEPTYPVAHQWYAELLMVLGRHDEAIREARRALELEPTSPILSRELAFKYYIAGRYPEAIEQLQETLELDPNFSQTRVMLADVYWAVGRKDELLEHVAHLDDRQRKFLELLVEDKNLEALAWLDSYPRQEYSLTTLSRYYAQAGGKEQALTLLEQALRERIPQICTTVPRPVFEPYRSDPRFVAIRQAMGLQP